MQPHSEVFTIIVAAFGSALQELMHWYGARFKLDEKRHQKMLYSPAYWIVTIGLCIGAGIGTWVWFYGEAQTPRTLMLTGAAFPLLLKKALKAIGDSSDTKLGGGSGALRDYLETA